MRFEIKISTFLKLQKRLKNSGNRIDGENNEERYNEEIHEEVTTEEGQSLAEEVGLSYYETRPTDKKIGEQIFHDLSLGVLQIRRRLNAY